MPETVKIGSVLQPGEFTKIYQTREIYQVLTYSMDFKASGERWNPLGKTVPDKCSFMRNKESVKILNDRKAQKWLVHRTYECNNKDAVLPVKGSTC